MCDFESDEINDEDCVRSIFYVAHDGSHRTKVEPGESAIEAVVRAEIRRGEAGDFTYSFEGGKSHGHTDWRIEAYTDSHFVYFAGICMISEMTFYEEDR